jgi:hypothetical protein
VLADVGRLGRSSPIAIQQQIGSFAVATLQTNRGTVAQEREDLVSNLGDNITFPRLVLPRTRLAESVAEPLCPAHHGVSPPVMLLAQRRAITDARSMSRSQG